MNLFGMGPLELGLVLALALVVFGPDKLPELARQIGNFVSQVRRISGEATAEFQRSISLDDPGVSRPKNSISGGISRRTDSEDSARTRGPEGPLPPY